MAASSSSASSYSSSSSDSDCTPISSHRRRRHRSRKDRESLKIRKKSHSHTKRRRRRHSYSSSSASDYSSMLSMTESPLKSSAGCHGPLSIGKPKFEPCGRFSRKTQLQLVDITSKLFGLTVATISNGVIVTKFCINQVRQSVRKMAIAEATKGRGLCGKSNKAVQAYSTGLGTSVIVPWLSRENMGA